MADAKKKRPMDEGFKRNAKIVVGALVLGLAVIGGFMALSGNKGGGDIPKSEIGKVVPGATGEVVDISPAAKERLTRVQEAEADAARRAGKVYIPDTTLGKGTPVNPQAAAAPAPQGGPPAGSYQQYQQNQQRVSGGGRVAELDDGLKSQMEMLLNTLAKPATVKPVTMLSKEQMAGFNVVKTAAAATTESTDPAATKKTLIEGNTILPALLRTPIDTYTTKFALSEIQSGPGTPAAGSVLRGEVVPMSQSGDVEDVGVKFTTMTINGVMCKVDAIALNEKTAVDAMNGDVDHRVFSKFVMPILMAGLSGASTYFTAKGTPATSVAAGTGTTTTSVIVNQDAATTQQAKDQGIGDAIDKGVQVGNQAVQKEAQRPNRVTLDANTPIGIIFNQPVTWPCAS